MVSATGPKMYVDGTTNTTSTNSTSTNNNDPFSSAAGGAMGKDQFVELLVAQMKNQDPLSPMDGKDLAAQLAQFSSVEQMMNANNKLDQIVNLLQPLASE